MKGLLLSVKTQDIFILIYPAEFVNSCVYAANYYLLRITPIGNSTNYANYWFEFRKNIVENYTVSFRLRSSEALKLVNEIVI